MLTICATIVIAAGLAMVWVRVVKTLTEPSGGPTTSGKPGALVWNGRVFTSSGQMKAYLTARGQSYSRWAARHPTAFGASAPTVTRHTTTKHPTTKHPTTTTKKHTTTTAKPSKPVTDRVAAPAVSATRPRPLTTTVLTILLLVAGLVLGGTAMLPRRLAPYAVQHFYAAPDRRMVALAAATAILLGFGVSFYLT